MNKKIAIIQTGQAIASVKQIYGDFDQWFIDAMNIDSALTQTYHVYKNTVFPEKKYLAGVIITGSPSMVTDQEHWSEETIQWLKTFVHESIPILGVCYGHQLLAKMLGGTVDYNPKGRQIGQVSMKLTNDGIYDELFNSIDKGRDQIINFNATHLQSVVVLPEHVRVLGSSSLDKNHCFKFKKHIWATQFHPEFDAEIMQAYIKARTPALLQEGLDPDELMTKVRPNDNGKLLLKQFKNMCFNQE